MLNKDLITECVVLAGGLGTRLRSSVPDLPKVLAPVAGKPFIHHVVEYLKSQGINRVIFSLGYMHEKIEDYINQAFPGLEKIYSIETEPLGTGGAISVAAHHAKENNIFIVNGDTLYKADLQALGNFHIKCKADCTLALQPMQNFDRYGVVETGEDGKVICFQEKRHYTKGLINAGLYVLQVENFLRLGMPSKFSFEKNYLETNTIGKKIMGMVADAYFIDIGVPADFERANRELV